MKSNQFKLLVLFLAFHGLVMAQEICTNSIDDDGDGLIDLLDPDCDCSGLLAGQVDSYIPNSSFEDMNCCPNGFSDLSCADTWIQASDATSDYFHSCDFMPASTPQPLPDGNACVGALYIGNWNEYVGACLNNTFLTGETYLLNMKIASAEITGQLELIGPNNFGAVNVTVFGSPNCTDLPFNGDYCPLELSSGGDWYELGSILYNPVHAWQEITIELNSPVDINAVVIGPPCNLPAGYPTTTGGNYPYFWYDDLILNEEGAFNGNIDDVYLVEDDFGDLVEVDQNILSANPDYGQFCFDQMNLNTEPGVQAQYQWFYEGVAIPGETDSVYSSSFEDYVAGLYTFGLFIDEDTCDITSIELLDPLYPIADMTIESVCTPDVGDIIHVSDGVTTITDWNWTVNTENVTGNDLISYTYNNNVGYDVKLIATAENFCQDTTEQTVQWPTFPEVDFSFTEVCENFSVQFSNETVNPDGTPFDQTWSFPGALVGSSVLNEPSNAYENSATYPVTLTVQATTGCTKSYVDSILIHPTPIAAFSVDALCFDSPVEVYDNASFIDIGSIEEVLWDFGDGNMSNEVDPVHEYTAPGTYPVQLHVTSGLGCTDSITLVQIVSEVIASFDYGNPNGCHPIVVDFESTSTSSDGSLVSYVWDFNNGDTALTSFEQPLFNNFDHIENKRYSISLTVTDEYGCTDHIEFEELIEVWPLPKAQFETELDYSNPLYPLAQFTNTTIGAEKYDWEFGDGEFSEKEHPHHYFEENNQYWVNLLATTAYYCQDTALKFLDIPAQNFIFVPNSFSPNTDGLNEYFEPIVTGPIAEYSLEIMDRWGGAIFKSLERGERWNGSYLNEQNHYVPDGIYVYRLVVRFEGEPENILNEGHISILR